MCWWEKAINFSRRVAPWYSREDTLLLRGERMPDCMKEKVPDYKVWDKGARL